jgi:Flp pilus assembly protein protease CpaA
MLSAFQFYWLSVGSGFVLVSAASIWEFKTSSIPNRLTLVFLVFGLLLGVFDHSWAFHITGFFFAAAPALVAYHRGYVGGGLTKLFAATGALCGAKVIVLMFLPLVLISGLLAYKAVRQNRSAPFPGSPMVLASMLLATVASRFVP